MVKSDPNEKGMIKMLVCDYIVKQIDGDYAHLERVDCPEEDWKLVARALLPDAIYEGCKLHYELMQYSICEQILKYCVSKNDVNCLKNMCNMKNKLEKIKIKQKQCTKQIAIWLIYGIIEP